MSLAVLLDQDLSWQRDRTGVRRVLVPPSPEKLKIIRDLVAGITGFDDKRGDQITVESLPFESTLSIEPPQPEAPPAAAPTAHSPAVPPSATRFDFRRLEPRVRIGAGVITGVLVLLAAALLLRRRRRARLKVSTPAELPAAAGLSASVPARVPGTELSTAQPAAAGQPRTMEQSIEAQLAERDARQQEMEAQALNSLKLAPVITKAGEVLAKHLRDKIAKAPDVSAQILRTWIRDEEG